MEKSKCMANPSGTTANQFESANLDLLRGTAVLFVVAFHLALFFGGQRVDALVWPLGHLGVLIFFVHTSMVLMFSLERQTLRYPGRGQFGLFMQRRWFRIAPLATFIVLTVVALRLPVGHLHDQQFELVSLSALGVLWNLLFVQNLTHTDSVLAPLWSLPYEMQMYLVLPALFMAVRNRCRLILLFGAWSAIVVLVLAWLRIDPHPGYDMPVYVPCFMAGVIAYRLTQTQQRNWPFFLWPVALSVITAGYVMHPSLQVGWACCLVLGLIAPKCREMSRGFARSGYHLLARYSYGIYLCHFICIWFAFVALGHESWIIRIAAFITSMIVLPVALYQLLELPMIRRGARFTSRRYAVTIAPNA